MRETASLIAFATIAFVMRFEGLDGDFLAGARFGFAFLTAADLLFLTVIMLPAKTNLRSKRGVRIFDLVSPFGWCSFDPEVFESNLSSYFLVQVMIL